MASNEFMNISLDENDVPGAKLSYCMIEKHSNAQLKRWLYCRDLKTTGIKQELVKRVKSCIEAGNEKTISVSVDSGKWFDLKLKQLKKEKTTPTAAVIPPITGWQKFPSVQLPKHFNKGHIHHHIVESVSFMGRKSPCGDNDDESDSDIEDIHTSKPLTKGIEYFKSGHVQDMQDRLKKEIYFLKAKVMASYSMNIIYPVLIQISKESGFVKDASCSCPASAMGRCAHITGLLYALDDYIEHFGTEPVTCTSVKCSWNEGRKKKRNPQNISKTNYPSAKKRKVDDILSHDVTPTFKERTPFQTLNSLLGQVESGAKKTSMWETILFRDYKDFNLEPCQLENLDEQVLQLTESLSVIESICEKISEQGTPEWLLERSVRITASEAKSFATTKSNVSIYNLLKKKMWGHNQTTLAMRYGSDHEDKAFCNYERTVVPNTVSVKKKGFWVNNQFPQLGASPDGLLEDASETVPQGILEIKCPFTLKDKLVQNYETVLSSQQLNNFCLHKVNGVNMLKKTHPYHYQVQMQMGVLDRQWCDLLIWGGEDNFLLLRVRFDLQFWDSLKDKLVEFHRRWLAPEYFQMRIPRRLLPKPSEKKN